MCLIPGVKWIVHVWRSEAVAPACATQRWGQSGDDGSPKQANTPETTEALGSERSPWAVPSDAGQGVCVSVWGLCPLNFPLFWMEARIDAGFIFTGRTPSLCHVIAVIQRQTNSSVLFFTYMYSIDFKEKAEDVNWSAVREFAFGYMIWPHDPELRFKRVKINKCMIWLNSIYLNSFLY